MDRNLGFSDVVLAVVVAVTLGHYYHGETGDALAWRVAFVVPLTLAFVSIWRYVAPRAIRSAQKALFNRRVRRGIYRHPTNG